MLLKLNSLHPSDAQIEKVVNVLRDGGVMIYPTDTVYAFGCDAHHPQAVARLCRIKGVDLSQANFSLIFSDIKLIGKYVKPMSNATFKMINRFLPGPFTFILNANGLVTEIYGYKKKTIGIRIPDNRVVQSIVRMLGRPLLSTSVHDDDAIIEYTTDPELIYNRHGHEVSMMIDGGFGNNEPSTVIDCTTDEVVVVREGLGAELVEDQA
ncbi:MAG: L-threonylcarbamoyladenylate synthase [Flavobacteriales bacterium]|nr:L-threonylcarbamoyladenylate synthase [Flavobacteriales bacterium]MDW8431483.1 L-threonylcarbamoyladenylate synthase [Flavobacteriales bacterium]